MKTLYIARHAEAVSIGYGGVQHDFDRFLTAEAEELLARQALGLKRLEPGIQACLSSPLLRARQTAEILCKPYGCPIESVDALGSMPQISEVSQLIQASPAHTLLLVTHQPFVVDLVSWLLTGDQELICHYSTATIACLRMHLFEPMPRGELLWLMNSSQLAQLG